MRYSLLALCLAVQSLASAASLQPTTTLSAETANNTSAAATWAGSPNGNIRAGNVSKQNIHDLLYPGHTTKVFAFIEPWWGKSSNLNIGYNSQDPQQVARQIADMQSRGIDGAILDWYGPGSYEDVSDRVFMQAAGAANFLFAIQIDQGAVKWRSCYPTCDLTTAVINLANSVASTYYGSPMYVRYNGRPLLRTFGMETIGYVDWDRVRRSISGNPVIVQRNPGGFTAVASSGAYAWLGPKQLDSFTPGYDGTDYLEYFYKTAAGYPDAITFGSAYKGFNDTIAAWAPPGGRHIDQNCGLTWLRTFEVTNKWYSATNQLDAINLVTWNDYEEGTALETGIDNCVTLTASVAGSVLNWSIGSGPQATIDHFVVFASMDGENLAVLHTLGPDARSLDLAQFGLGAGSYKMFVKAVGKPSIVNKMSAAVGFTVKAPNKAPVASVSVTPATGVAPVTVTVSAADSYDSDGRIASSAIDFGNGTVLPGPVASHTYTTAGNHTITATVTDDAGAKASAPVSVSLGAAGIKISEPITGATVKSPVRIVASSVPPTGRQISSTRVYVDGQSTQTVSSSSLDAHVPMSPGTRQVVVQSWDNTGAVYRASLALTVVNQPPTAVLTLSPAFTTTGAPISATLSGTDADGSVSAYQIDFGDGRVVQTATASHAYKSAGTYTVRGSVTDNNGAVTTTTKTVTITQVGVKVTSPSDGATVSGPVRIIASAAAPAGRQITAMRVYVDGTSAYTTYAAKIDTYLSMPTGARLLVIQAWDNTGAVYRASLTVNVAPKALTRSSLRTTTGLNSDPKLASSPDTKAMQTKALRAQPLRIALDLLGAP